MGHVIEMLHILRPGWVMLAAALLLAACGTTPMQFSDNSAPSAGFRLVKRIDPAGSSGIEFEASRARGKGVQTLGSNESVSAGATLVSGPAQLRHETRVTHAHIAFNRLLFADRPVQLEWFAGVAFNRMQWTTETGQAALPRYEIARSWTGPMGGVLGRWRVNDLLAFEGRLWAAGRNIFQAGDYQNAAELALAVTPTRALRLRAGVAQTEAGIDQPSGFSEVTTTLRGPFLALTPEF